MARKPKYRRHTTRDLGFVEHGGKRIYLPGPYRSEESFDAYRNFLRSIGFHIVGGEQWRPPRVLIALVASRFLTWADATYPLGARSETSNLHAALKLFTDWYEMLPADKFTPLKLKEFQGKLAALKLSRNYINATVSRVKRMFKWAVSEELVEPSIYGALATVQGLRKGRSTARETKPRQPVSWEHVSAVLLELSPTIRAMVLLQWFTGVRPQSVCRARAEQFDRSKEPWEWSPRHKGEYQDRSLLVYVGPQCQAVLAPFLRGKKPREFLFQPLHLNGRRAKGFRSFYDSVSYLRAITRAIDRVNRQRADAGLPLMSHWTPHQLRHARGTLVREKHGLEAAQAALGHARIDATQLYAQKQLALAKMVAETMG